MEFPVCPGCKQSVLDDDAVNCPFCGASMSGKGEAAKPAARPASRPASRSPRIAKEASSSELPFKAESLSQGDAVKLAKKPQKGAALAIKCPMCESVGYGPSLAAGRQVRCVNPGCMVPVFRAPVAESNILTATIPQAAPRRSSSFPLVAGMLTLILLIGGGIAYLVVSNPGDGGPKKGVTKQDDLDLMKDPEPQPLPPKPVEPPVKTTVENPPPIDTPAVATATLPDDFPAPMLKMIREACLQSDRQNRSKPYCRQVSAEIHAIAGDLDGTREQLVQLAKVGKGVPFYAISGNLELFWRCRELNRADEAKNALSEALTSAEKLPQYGRARLELSSRLAAALFAAGNPSAGNELLDRIRGEGPLAEFAALTIIGDRLLTVAHQRGWQTFAPALPWKNPQRVAVVAELVGRGQNELAQSWALAQADPVIRTDCVSAWYQLQPSLNANAELPDLSSIESFPPEEKLRVIARLGQGLCLRGRTEQANAVLEIAQPLVEKIGAKGPLQFPSSKAMMTLGTINLTAVEQAAGALADLGLLEALLGNRTAAETHLTMGLVKLREPAPALRETLDKSTAADQESPAGARKRLRDELGLKNEDEARIAVNNYRRALNELLAASQRSFEGRLRLLANAARTGQADAAWKFVSITEAETESWLQPGLVQSLMFGATSPELKSAITEAWNSMSMNRPAPILWESRISTAQGPQAWSAIAKELQILPNEDGERDRWALLALERVADLSHEDLLAFLSGTTDMILREELATIASLAISQKSAAECAFAWKHAQGLEQATEKLAWCRGLIGGFKPAPKPMTETTETTEPNSPKVNEKQ